jgi:hypothetical protein
MLPDPPDHFSEKPFPDFDAPAPAEIGPPAETDFPGRSMERFARRTYSFLWNGPTGFVAVIVRQYENYFGSPRWIDIEVPPGTLFPLGDLSFPAGLSEITRAGGVRAFVQRILATAEGTDYWKDAAARARQGDLFGARTTLDAPRRPRRRRHLRRRPVPGR